MPRLLLTNIHLREFGGSEMVTLELAEEFILRGWNVDVFAPVIGEPFITEFDALQSQGLRVSDDPDYFSDEEYDLLWVHHSVLPRAVARRLGDHSLAPRIVWNHMSAFADLELPLVADIEARVANVITFVSPEAQAALQRFGLPAEKSQLLQNPAPRSFLSVEPTMPPRTLQTILLVSNHPPVEVDAAAEALEKEGLKVLRVGGTNPQRMQPTVLQQADAVITIGKTTQYALCVGLPVFEYDHFGGCGWISSDNFENEFRTNFSGRTTRRKLSADEIVTELHFGYAKAREFAASNVSLHRERFSLERRIDSILSDVNKAPITKFTEEDALRWEAVTAALISLYTNLMLEADRVREQLETTKVVRHEAAQAVAELESLLADATSARLQIARDARNAEEALEASRNALEALEGSKALRLGRMILSPIYRIQRARKR